MDMQMILEGIWSAVNSPIGIGAIAAVALWLLNRLYAARPQWQSYEGSIIAAIKFAEQEIPDDVPNKGLARLDAALRYVLQVYEEVNKRIASAKVVAELKEGIQIKHAELEKAGQL